jgi:hypothetical protein
VALRSPDISLELGLFLGVRNGERRLYLFQKEVEYRESDIRKLTVTRNLHLCDRGGKAAAFAPRSAHEPTGCSFFGADSFSLSPKLLASNTDAQPLYVLT